MAASASAAEHAPSGVRLIPRPSLFELLGAAERVVHVSAPAGSGKTFLLRSWIAAEGLAERTAWVSVSREEHDPQAFWLAVLLAARGIRLDGTRDGHGGTSRPGTGPQDRREPGGGPPSQQAAEGQAQKRGSPAGDGRA